jgi:predicted alpha/beta-hydrolase family hydrolase
MITKYAEYGKSKASDSSLASTPLSAANATEKHQQQRELQNKEEQSLLVNIPSGSVELEGNLEIPKDPIGIVLFAHGSGSSRHSTRNKYVAKILRESKIATLLFDLLTAEEEEIDNLTRHLRFDINLLSTRLIDATNWIRDYNNNNKSETGIINSTLLQKGSKENTNSFLNLNIGYFGASTGAAAALVASSKLQYNNNNGINYAVVNSIVSRGGRPDLAGVDALLRVRSPTLLIVGGNDEVVIELNKQALDHLANTVQASKLVIVPGATHLFEEPGTLEKVAELAADWFVDHFRK